MSNLYQIFQDLMSSSFYLISGVLYINMGSEIMFVLLNRMKAQSIDMNTVGSKILTDITLLMFKPSFIQSIIKPCTPLSIQTLYQVFAKMVNCSNMKLDKNSMQKLFYLVLMTFKKQIFNLSSPLQLYTLTLTHLYDVLNIQKKQNLQAIQCINQCIQAWKKQYEDFSYVQYLQFKQQILSMLEIYKSRIVLFCQTGGQQQNGNLIFCPRNTHNRKNIGFGQNHPDIQFKNNTQWLHAKNMQYSNYKNWKTVLGKDDYDNVRGSSKMLESKIKKQIVQQSSKSIADILGTKNIKLDNFQLQLNIFQSQKSETKTQSSKSQLIKTVQANGENDIKKMIQKQFGDINIKDNQKEDEQIDLLQLMDS